MPVESLAMTESTGKSSPVTPDAVPGSDLKHYEQQVNDRLLTSPAPAIDDRFLPENAASLPLAWRKIPRHDVEVFLTTNRDLESALPALLIDSFVLMPIHPLSENRYRTEELIYSGNIQFSASYRTVFFEPERGGILCDWIPDGMALMLKLSLEEPLPGIPGDRRLTREKIEKCILLSDALPLELKNDPLANQFEVVPEFLGISSKDCGAIFRLLRASGVLPVFSLYSTDRTKPAEPPFIVRRLQEFYGGDSVKKATELGDQLAKPLVQALLAGFRAGFSMEMHAQNTLFSPGEKHLFDRVYFRDMEGIVFSNKFRTDRGLQPLFSNHKNTELLWEGKSMRRWFNRNLDHDLGRIFRCAVDVLLGYGVIDNMGKRTAIASIRQSVRQAIESAELRALDWPSQFLPYSRAPWGNGLRLGDYFRTRYR